MSIENVNETVKEINRKDLCYELGVMLYRACKNNKAYRYSETLVSLINIASATFEDMKCGFDSEASIDFDDSHFDDLKEQAMQFAKKWDIEI